MTTIKMEDILPMLGISYDTLRNGTINIPCPQCDSGKGRHLNIDLVKNVFRCPKCGWSGGVFDLYAYYTGLPRKGIRSIILARLGTEDCPIVKKPKIEIVPEMPQTDIDTRDQTYRALLNKLTLASDHRDNLRKRGLSDDLIDSLGYKTTPVIGMSLISKQLIKEGLYLAGVPGFYRQDDGSWTLRMEKRGIMIPVKDSGGRIQGIQIRRDNTEKRKFRWLSSSGQVDGCAAKTWVHVAGVPSEIMFLTEGPMKADIIHALSGYGVIAVPGVSSLGFLPDTLRKLKGMGLQKIMTCFDMDMICNPFVQDAQKQLGALLEQEKFTFGTYFWNPAYKGLDDYLWAAAVKKGNLYGKH